MVSGVIYRCVCSAIGVRVVIDIMAVTIRARSRSTPSRCQTMAISSDERPMRSTNNVRSITSPIWLGTLKSHTSRSALSQHLTLGPRPLMISGPAGGGR
jgi:hypothetical protein